MKQKAPSKFNTKVKTKKGKPHKKHLYGTSKLEQDFAREYLDVIGVKYIYQFEAKDIGRFYDFFLPEENLLIEVDGNYYHSYGLTYEQMSPMQKRNKRVDELKDKWALMHSIPLLRFWEHDIRNNPELIFNQLKIMIGKQNKKKQMNEKRKRPH